MNPSTTSLAALGSLLSILDVRLEALEYLKKALEREESESGKCTIQYAKLQERIGANYSELGQFGLALSWYHRARAGFENHGQSTRAGVCACI